MAFMSMLSASLGTCYHIRQSWYSVHRQGSNIRILTFYFILQYYLRCGVAGPSTFAAWLPSWPRAESQHTFWRYWWQNVLSALDIFLSMRYINQTLLTSWVTSLFLCIRTILTKSIHVLVQRGVWAVNVFGVFNDLLALSETPVYTTWQPILG